MSIRAVVLKMSRNMLPSLVINAVLPLLIYLYLKPIHPDPSIVPIGAAALFPVLGNVLSLVRSRSLDPIGVAMLSGFGFTLAAIFVTGDPRVILVSRSLLTLGMGLVSLLSLLLPKTISFYFARQFLAGPDPARVSDFNGYWRIPYVRQVSRVTSLVWGLALVCEFALRVAIVYTQPVAEVLVLTPIVFNVMSMSTMAWTVWYGTRAVRRIRRDSGELMGSPAPSV